MPQTTDSAGMSAREYSAKYSFSGTGDEMLKSISLAAGEKLLFSAIVQRRRNGVLFCPALLWVTTQRVLLLSHHLLTSDKILELPRAAIMQVSFPPERAEWIEISYSSDEGPRTLQLREPPLGRRMMTTERTVEIYRKLYNALYGADPDIKEVLSSDGPIARRQRRSVKTSMMVSGLVLAGFGGAFLWNLWLLPQFTAARDAYHAAPECNQLPAADVSAPSASTSGLCHNTEVQVSSRWYRSGRYSTSYHLALIDQDGNLYPDVGFNHAVLWRSARVNQHLGAQVMDNKVMYLRSAQAEVMTADHPDSRLSLARRRVIIFGITTLLTLFLFQQQLRARSKSLRGHARSPGRSSIVSA